MREDTPALARAEGHGVNGAAHPAAPVLLAHELETLDICENRGRVPAGEHMPVEQRRELPGGVGVGLGRSQFLCGNMRQIDRDDIVRIACAQGRLFRRIAHLVRRGDPGRDITLPGVELERVGRVGPWTTGEEGLVLGFDVSGGSVARVHVEALARGPGLIERAQMLGFPGGFSYGDDIASGRILAMTLRERLWAALRASAQRGVPMIGACNGFQVMVQLGLLPGFASSYPERPPKPVLALAHNADGRFVDRWTHVEVPSRSVCLWTAPWRDGFNADELMLPSAHG